MFKTRQIKKILVLQECSCGALITIGNADYIGTAMGLDHWNCPNCGTTITVRATERDEEAA